jgi:putative transposase
MPRRQRIRIPGLTLHVTQRGNNRLPCFWTETDRRVYLSLLREMSSRFECAIHAYVLMTNHVHLLLTSEAADGASLMMKNLGQQYVQYVNRTRQRTGSLWDGRFKSSIVDTDLYLFRCHQYVEMNPVRARLTGRPGDYPWSSHLSNACDFPSDIVKPHQKVLALGTDADERKEAYRRLFDLELTAGELEEIRAATEGGFALGSDEFLERLEGAIGGRASRTRQRSTSCVARTPEADQVV